VHPRHAGLRACQLLLERGLQCHRGRRVGRARVARREPVRAEPAVLRKQLAVQVRVERRAVRSRAIPAAAGPIARPRARVSTRAPSLGRATVRACSNDGVGHKTESHPPR
jgi:hypothetical protein